MVFIRYEVTIVSSTVAANNNLLRRLLPSVTTPPVPEYPSVPAAAAAAAPPQPTEPAPEADFVNISNPLNFTVEVVGRMEAVITVRKAHGSPPAP